MYLFKTLQSNVNLLVETIFQLNLKFYANELLRITVNLCIYFLEHALLQKQSGEFMG